ncbi:hypothetical protein, partial [Endozoicomonas numazuensis]
FSSMNSGRGFPKKEEVLELLSWTDSEGEKIWYKDGRLNLALLSAFSSMNNGRGFPKKEEVLELLGWTDSIGENIWYVGGQFSPERLHLFSSMNSGRGLPKKEDVLELLGWTDSKGEKIWYKDGQFSPERLRAFSSMNNGRGLPKKEAVLEVLRWLDCEEHQETSSVLSLMSKLHVSGGLPDIKTLKNNEHKLSNLFFPPSADGLESDDEDAMHSQIKQAALFLSAHKPDQVLSFETVKEFNELEKGNALQKLKKLLTLLTANGGTTVRHYLKLSGPDRPSLLKYSASRMPLPLTLKAINDFPEKERDAYLFFCKELNAAPDRKQWKDIHLQLNRLESVLESLDAQKIYLEVIWRLAPPDRAHFLDETVAESVIKILPYPNVLKMLAGKHSAQWLKALLEACYRYQQQTPSREDIQLLFTVLLEAQLPLNEPRDIPDHFMFQYRASGVSGTFIETVPPVQTAEELALHFVTSSMDVLSNMFYRYEGNRLRIEQYGGEMHTLPRPELDIQDAGIEIRNWSIKDFHTFLVVTEFPEQYYLPENVWHQHCNPEPPLHAQRRLKTCDQRKKEMAQATHFQPLSIPALLGLLAHNVAIKPGVWRSYDHYKKKLPRAALDQLLKRVEQASHEEVPESLRAYLEASTSHLVRAVEPPPPEATTELPDEKEQLKRLWSHLSRKEYLVSADIDLLTGYKEYMSMEQIVGILNRVHVDVAHNQLNELKRLLGEKRNLHAQSDPLLLDLPGEVFEYLVTEYLVTEYLSN